MHDYFLITIHLVSAIVAGGIIGLERSFHGRPAGFRTHTLVCLASSLLMLLTLYQWQLLPGVPRDTINADPSRMAQGIMTGIGFLGAGVIFKEGFTVRGLTTAASIWITAAIGIMFGIGFYFPAVLATLMTLGTLSLFRWIEVRLPSHYYAHYQVSFDRQSPMPESELRQFIMDKGFTIANMSYAISHEGRLLEYSMILRTSDQDNISVLAHASQSMEIVRIFRIAPTRD
ncbi:MULTISPECIES: MgtC/SapB family protein [Methylobacillus]|uniref:Protein MgtC n=1 Tax=Methylobacillus flagellatus (strain ATCC 51484 / DSM 6875 / VKM B-1610 / KT) TaxID=265072 RepID=Q1H4Z1_METFK|nr:MULTISPECIES: MgtC/SapB family protein [Methylobacillus]ABE48446.1 MgtC/SapB transporter [Methylobacillus flagellatus KT]MPS48241.1 MgtC/SapB family protein [Methylobacillus sp.]